MRDDTTSRQTGQCAYFAAQAPQRMWPQGTRAVDFSGSKQIGHSSRSGVPGAAAGAGAAPRRGGRAAAARPTGVGGARERRIGDDELRASPPASAAAHLPSLPRSPPPRSDPGQAQVVEEAGDAGRSAEGAGAGGAGWPAGDPWARAAACDAPRIGLAARRSPRSEDVEVDALRPLVRTIGARLSDWKGHVRFTTRPAACVRSPAQ